MATQKFVVLRVTMEIVERVPADWSEDQINFYKNESSLCANNTARTMTSVFERAAVNGAMCLCDRLKVEYVREASPGDVERDGLRHPIPPADIIGAALGQKE